MPISFQCSCGKRLQVADSLAGKKIRCTGCQKAVAVPASSAPAKAGPRPEAKGKPSPAMPAKPPAKAPAKKPALDDFDDDTDFDPSADDDFAPPPAKKTAPTRRPAFEDEDDDDDFPAAASRPVSAAKQGRGLVGTLVLFLLGVLVGGGAGLAVFDYLGIRVIGEQPTQAKNLPPGKLQDPFGKQPDGNKPPVAAELTRELKFVPADAQGFLSVRVADWVQGPAGKALKESPSFKKFSEELANEIGLAPADIDRLLVVLPKLTPPITTDPSNSAWIFLAANKPLVDLPALKRHTDKPASANIKEHDKVFQAYQFQPNVYFHIADEKLLLLGKVPALAAFLKARPDLEQAPPGEWSKELQAAETHHVVLAGQVPPDVDKLVPPEFTQKADALMALKVFNLKIQDADNLNVDARLVFSDEAKAKEALALLEQGRETLKGFLPFLSRKTPEEMTLASFAEAGLKALQINIEDTAVVAQVTFEDTKGALARAFFKQAFRTTSAGPPRALRNNLAQLALALHAYNDVYRGKLPIDFSGAVTKPVDPKDKDKGLSWRVAILPFIEEGELFKKFKLDEPWDSPDNLKLLAEMPKVFRPLKSEGIKEGYTHLQYFTGPECAFGGPVPVPGIPRSFTRGTSNTLVIGEAELAVPWTKPADIPIQPNMPFPKLGHHDPSGFFAAAADGSVHFLKFADFDEDTLRTLICPYADKIPEPPSNWQSKTLIPSGAATLPPPSKKATVEKLPPPKIDGKKEKVDMKPDTKDNSDSEDDGKKTNESTSRSSAEPLMENRIGPAWYSSRWTDLRSPSFLSLRLDHPTWAVLLSDELGGATTTVDGMSASSLTGRLRPLSTSE